MAERRALTPPRDLTIPEAGSTTARDILSRAIGRLLGELRPLLRAHASLAPPTDFEAFDRVLVTLLRDRVGPLASVLRRPNVGALIRTLRRPPEEADAELLRELIGLVAFELAVHGELPFELQLKSFPVRFLSIAGRAAVDVPPDVESVVLSSGWMRTRAQGEVRELDLGAMREQLGTAPGVRRPFTAIDGDTFLAIEDNNPLALDEAHPDKSGNAIDLGQAPVRTWVETLRTAFELVARYLPDVRREMDVYVTQIIPVGTCSEKHLSASYREAIGTIYMTLHPQPMTMTEALIHEFQHNKLNALFEVDDVLDNAYAPLYRSPVRPDPRPLAGVLLAVHAFLPVARLYERMIADGHPSAAGARFRERFAQVIAINREGTRVLEEHAQPTAVGAALLAEFRHLDDHFRALNPC